MAGARRGTGVGGITGFVCRERPRRLQQAACCVQLRLAKKGANCKLKCTKQDACSSWEVNDR